MKRPAPAKLKAKANAKKTRSPLPEPSGSSCNVRGLGVPPKKRAPPAAPFAFAKTFKRAGGELDASVIAATEDDVARRKTPDARALSDWEEEGGRVADGVINPATHQKTPSRARDAG